MDMITVSMPFQNQDPAWCTVSMSGNEIIVTVRGGLPSPEPRPDMFVLPIGRLPAGVYPVHVMDVDFGPAVQLGSATVTVVPRPAGQPLDDYTDIWWNPQEPGWGLNIAQHADGQLFATWLTYGADGLPVWYVMPGGSWRNASSFVGDIYRTSGPDMLDFKPEAVTRTKVGTATFSFLWSRLSAEFDIDGTQVFKTLQRQSF